MNIKPGDQREFVTGLLLLCIIFVCFFSREVVSVKAALNLFVC